MYLALIAPILPLLMFVIVFYILFVDEKINPRMVKIGDKYAIQYGYIRKSYVDLRSSFRLTWSRDSRFFKDCLGDEEEVRTIYARIIEKPVVIK